MRTRGIVAVSLMVLAVILPTCAALFKVWVYQEALELGYRLSKAEEQRQKLSASVQALEVELAAEKTPERLNQLAAALNLTAPNANQIVSAAKHKNGGKDGRP